ncbi:hypothetical protein NM208_g14840 [Fusarium decemcellulare]|uniref:Uncharacterized protein n=1 Tax=Fusarium decemcellulare TaxID=57161 RepID=A0ACC1RGL5_9HYPO|nr:hypothetical protein NM208_g14840 [Fusarium decemcellulare]
MEVLASIVDVFVALVTKTCYATAILAASLFLAAWLFTAKQDQHEPPLLHPNIPFIGHIIDLIRHQSTFLTVLARRRLPIATLPMLNGKVYAVFDGNLIQSAQSNKDLSMDPFVVEYAQKELGYDDATAKIINESNVMTDIFHANRAGLAPHQVHQMNVTALSYVSDELHDIGGGQEIVIPNVWLWVRELMTMATCEALFGSDNPIAKAPGLIDDLWLFDRDLPLFLLNLFPSITARKAYQARERLKAVMGEYYANSRDVNSAAAKITSIRAEALRKNGIQGFMAGVIELSFVMGATLNSIPTLFWLIANIITRSDLVSRLRDEVSAVAEHGPEDAVIVRVHLLADKCPLLVSCYREVIRLSNRAQSNRRVMADTTITDGEGRSYLLKEGLNVQMPSEHLHSMEEVWGPDADNFNPERFLDNDKNFDKAASKARRVSYIPFGSGRHLCPGRNFAFAENLGFMATLLLGYDISPINGDWSNFKVPEREKCSLATAVCKPQDDGKGFGMRIKERAGWEGNIWVYTSRQKESANSS